MLGFFRQKNAPPPERNIPFGGYGAARQAEQEHKAFCISLGWKGFFLLMLVFFILQLGMFFFGMWAAQSIVFPTEKTALPAPGEKLPPPGTSPEPPAAW